MIKLLNRIINRGPFLVKAGCIIFFLLLSTATLKSQNLRGISYSNYSGTQGLYHNPATIADSRHKFYANLFTIDMHVSNSFVRYNAGFTIFRLAKKLSAGEDSYSISDYLEGKLDGDRKIFSAGIDVKGPSAMYALDDYNSIALTTRIRSGLQVNNMSEAVARLLVLGAETPELQNLDFFRKRFDLNIITISEVGLSYASTIFDNGTSFLKAGLTVKRLGGIYSAHFINKEATYKILEDLEHPDEQNIYIDQLKANYGYVQDYDNRNLYQVHNWITGSRMPGNGFGMDAGIVYESRPTSRYYTYQMDGRTYKDNTFNKYNYRIGIAIIDLGGIRYKGDHVKSYNVATQNIDFKINDFDGANNADEINDTIEEILGPQIVKTKFKSGLPTALNLNIDVKLLYNMYVSMVWMPGLRSNSSINMRHNSFVAIVPRYEKKHVELSLPISLSENYHNFSTGAMLRVGQVFVGSDNIAGLLNIGNPHGLNLYSGLTIPISNKKLKDSDLDGVSDKKDKCPYEKGIARFEGCPDLDQDGIPDYLDNCPEAFGTKSNAGCPVIKQVNGYKEIQLSKEESKIIKDVYDNVEFETGKASLSSSSSASLAKLADLLLKRPGYKLLIEGHTDNTGLAESNMILSLDRANSFRDFLINKGVNPEILIANGYGSERPIADNNNDKGRKLNRRVEFKFIQ